MLLSAGGYRIDYFCIPRWCWAVLALLTRSGCIPNSYGSPQQSQATISPLYFELQLVSNGDTLEADFTCSR